MERQLRRFGRWLVPEEARQLARHQRLKALAAAAALLVYADGARACSEVPPGGITAAVISERTIDEIELDRAASVVHASFRGSPSAFTRGDTLRFPGTDRALRRAGSEEAGAREEVAPGMAPVPAAQGVAAGDGAAATLRSASQVAAAMPAPFITQGEFAILLASTLRLRAPRRGWTEADATTTLSALRLRPGQAAGVLPSGGWRLDQPLTEGDLAFVLGYLGLRVTSREPARPLTAAEVELVLARLASLFRSLSPAAYTAAPASSRSLTLGNPRAPLSPITP